MGGVYAIEWAVKPNSTDTLASYRAVVKFSAIVSHGSRVQSLIGGQIRTLLEPVFRGWADSNHSRPARSTRTPLSHNQDPLNSIRSLCFLIILPSMILPSEGLGKIIEGKMMKT